MAKQKMTEDRFKGIRKAIEEGRDRRAIMEYWNIKQSTYRRVKATRTFAGYVAMRCKDTGQPQPKPKSIVVGLDKKTMKSIAQSQAKSAAGTLAAQIDKAIINQWKPTFKAGDRVIGKDGNGPYYVAMPSYMVEKTVRVGLFKKRTVRYEEVILTDHGLAVNSVYDAQRDCIKRPANDYQMLGGKS